MPSLYLINPRSDYPAYYGAEVFNELGLPPAAFMADLRSGRFESEYLGAPPTCPPARPLPGGPTSSQSR